MRQRPGADSGQADLFGAVAKPKVSKARVARPRGSPAERTPDAPDDHAAPELGIAGVAARLSPADLEELAAVLSDDALARLVVAAVRQLRRRLARGGGRVGRPSASLERAARQLAAELGGEHDADES